MSLRRVAAASPSIRKLGSVREPVDDLIDRLRFRMDRYPLRDYQPVPWLGVNEADRAAGTRSRWEVMLPIIRAAQVEDAVDVGCDAGWFCLQLAFEGIRAIGVESDPPQYRTAILAARKSGLTNVGVLVMEVQPDTVQLLPATDCRLFLSVWHHIVRHYGLEAAGAVLRSLWGGTRKLLFFDTGEREMDASFGLPAMDPDPRTWIARYLEDNCDGGTVDHLGTHDAFTPDRRPCRRDLFVVTRGDST